MDIKSLIKSEINYTREKNVYHFIDSGLERPRWSSVLDDYYKSNPYHLQIKRQYQLHRNNIYNDAQMKKYFQYITEAGGVTVDLASGPSGYFSPVFDFLKDDSVFIATDASRAIINAHKKANNDKRFFVFDVDLDNGLPFDNGCIDAFSGNLLNNVDNYRELLSEVSRCLKSNGRFAVIELFYEVGSQTYDYLKQRNAVFSSLEYYIEVCNEFGLKYRDSEIRREIIGKISEGDLFPIGENDRCLEMIVYFEKI